MKNKKLDVIELLKEEVFHFLKINMNSKDLSINSILFLNLFRILNKYNCKFDEFSENSQEIITPKILSVVFEDRYLKKNNVSKNTGSFYTPSNISLNLIETILKLREFIPSNFFPRILDPSCGGGEFLVNSAESLLKRKSDSLKIPKSLENYVLLRKEIVINYIYGIDIEPTALFITNLRLLFWIFSPILTNYEKNQHILKKIIEEDWPNFSGNIGNCDFLELKGDNFEKVGLKYTRFNIIIGNPPFNVKIPSNTEKHIKSKYNKPIKNSAAYFLLIGKNLLEKNGLLGFIMPKSIAYSRGWNTVKTSILDDLLYIKDISKAFSGVKLEQIILVISKNIKEHPKLKKYKENYINESSFRLKESETFAVSKKIWNGDSQENPLILGLSLDEYILFQKINTSIHSNIGDYIWARRGFNIQKLAIKNSKGSSSKNKNGEIHCFGGKEIKQFGLNIAPRVIQKEKIKKYLEIEQRNKVRIIGQLANAHVKNPKPHFKLAFFPLAETSENNSNFITFDTVINIFMKENNTLFYYILGYLNSNLFAWYLYRIIYSGAIRSTRLDEIYLRKVPFLHLNKEDENEEHLIILIDSVIKALLMIKQFNIFMIDEEKFVKKDKIYSFFEDFYNDILCLLYLGQNETKELVLKLEDIINLKKFCQLWDNQYKNYLLFEIPIEKEEATEFFQRNLNQIEIEISKLKTLIKNILNYNIVKQKISKLHKSMEYKIIRSPFFKNIE
ncbi:MAG: N-6 DNA methylase [archaeon]|nr:N-6 DNA methylase [archaeon]